jgi:acetylornithine deacetylase/succinyl-diaminopimelate desuccinylase-like protein
MGSIDETNSIIGMMKSGAMAKLYEAAKVSQWNASTDVDWSIDVDPHNPERPLLPDSYVPVKGLPIWEKLSRKEQTTQIHAMTSWMLSQFLHGEQGALFAACQVTTAVPWLDGKLYGSGASDDKAGIAVCMAVGAAYAHTQPPIDLWLVWVVCEETDGSGSLAFAEWFKTGWQPRYADVGAMLFESTECRWLEYEAKGNVFLRIHTEGGCGHAALKPQLGTSAITRMAQAVPCLEAMEAGWRAQGLAEPTALVTAVRAGDPSAPNRLDAACEMVVDVRTTAPMHGQVVGDVTAALADVPHRLEVLGACPPGYTAPDAPFIQAFELVLPGVEKVSGVASNDMFAFTGIDVPAFIFGPGTKEAIHRPNEYVELGLLARCIDLVEAFVGSLGGRQ